MSAEQTNPEALRAFLRSGQLDAHRGLAAFADWAEALLAKARHPGEPAARAGEWIFLLGQALRSQRDPALTARLMQLLAASGRLARAFIILHMQSRALPLPQFAPLLATLPGRHFLALLNDMLLDQPAEDKAFTAWVKSLLPAPGHLDLREALVFVKDTRDPLAPALREALLSGGLGASVAKALGGSPGIAAGEALIRAASVLATPQCRSASLAYAMRTAGGAGANRLGPLLAAPPDLDDRDTALAGEMRRVALGANAAPQLLPAAHTEPETLGLVLADLVRNGGQQAAVALRLLPLLPRLGVESCLADLPPETHAPLLPRLFSVAAALEPEFLARAAKSLGQNLEEDAARAVAAMLSTPTPARDAKQPGAPGNLQHWKTAGPRPQPAQPPQEKTQKARCAALADAAGRHLAQLKDQDFSGCQVGGLTFEAMSINACDLAGCRFSGVRFVRVRIGSSLLAGSRFENCLFEECTFSAADLSNASFFSCRFASCLFESSDLSRALFSGCALAGGCFSESSLAGALLDKTRLDGLDFRCCTLSGLHCRECSLVRLSLFRMDFCGALSERCLWRDCEWRSCSLAATRFVDSEEQGLAFVRANMAGVVVLGGHTDNPHLTVAKQETLAMLLEGPLAATAPLPPALEAGTGAEFVRATAEIRLRVNEARRTLCAMRGQDHRRRELALARMTETQGQFLTLLPALLATDVFERSRGLAGVPACAVSGPGRPGGLPRGALARLERLFPGHEPAQKAAPALIIEAVYAIGSLGSVAQRPSSDMDCWVCLGEMPRAADVPADPAEFAQARAGLARKLAALESWAGEQFGLEVHFFLMTLDEVRRNDFGMSDKESSGSAQAALLKEEFYRTALKLAGRDLLWWAAPPVAAQDKAEALLAELARFAPRTAAELLDLGQPSPIPPEEFFGACLWQIVKALHSPYKSVMKLGLLEKYAGQGQDTRLLCDRIKEAVMRGRRLMADVDPYLSLFTSIRKHYRQREDATSLALIGECLRLKTDVAPEDMPSEFWTEGDDGISALSSRPEGWTGTFEAALRLGGMVNLFMVSAYRRIQEDIGADGAAQITPEDLTRLGRRIAANFSQQPNKVSLVPFLSDDLMFNELCFSAEKAPGKRTIWMVKGKNKNTGKTPVEALPPIRRDTDVARLLAWLLFNGLYDPKQTVLAEKTMAPIAVADLQAVLADMAAFFPRRATLEPDLDEYLQPERVVRAYGIVNLPVAPEKNKITTFSVIYATNWGEVFTQTFDNPPPTLLKSPASFLWESLDKVTPYEALLRIFTPRRAACPRLKLI